MWLHAGRVNSVEKILAQKRKGARKILEFSATEGTENTEKIN